MGSIGQVVKELREAKRLSQADVQELTKGKIKTSWLASLETGRISTPTPDKLEFLATFLGTTLLEIYRRAGIVELPTPAGLTEEEEFAIEKFRRLPPKLKEAVIELIGRLGEDELTDPYNPPKKEKDDHVRDVAAQRRKT